MKRWKVSVRVYDQWGAGICEVCDRVVHDSDIAIITRKNDENVVLMSQREDFLYWQKMDKKIAKKINGLIKDIKGNPFEGFGKPEPLKYDLAGKWSRRMTDEHRLVYQMEENNLIVFTCRYHY